MKKNRLYVDVHVLQTLPPSCVNRDDTGSPKTAVYGGVTRARVSSQSWKKAIRDMFKTEYEIPREKLSERTKKIVEMVADEIYKLDEQADAEKLAQKVLESAGLKIKSVEKGTDALFFMSRAQAKALATLAVNGQDVDKAVAKQALRDSPGIDIALFGRMVADDPSLNTDACAQVAHSISTHKVNNEYDYFTAVDDLSREDTAGAGHIGTVEFNSSTLYRYATVAVHELYAQLGNDTTMAVREFVRAFACSMPTGKLNTFANRTLPDTLLVTIRDDQPLNLVGAFEKPVYSRDGGYVSASVKTLDEHAKKVYQTFAAEPTRTLAVGEWPQSQDVMPLPELLEALTGEISKRFYSDGDEQ